MKNAPFATRLRFALRGIRRALGSERSMRVHAAALLAVFAVLVVVRPAPLWWALLVSACGLVIVAELLNTALEALADRLHPEHHPLIAHAKDYAAGAVLIASLMALAVAMAFVVDLLY